MISSKLGWFTRSRGLRPRSFFRVSFKLSMFSDVADDSLSVEVTVKDEPRTLPTFEVVSCLWV